MDPGTWKKVLGFLTQLSNTFRKVSAQTGTKPAEWYFDLTTACLGQAQQMISGNDFPPVEFTYKQRRHFTKIPGMAVNIYTGAHLYHSQCEYLVEKLATAVFICREIYLQSRYHKILKVLCRLATNVRGFVHGCCKDGGMQVALTAASVPLYVCSLGFYLEACTRLLRHSNNSGVALPTQTELDSLREAEMHEVERRDLLDEAILVDTINSVILHGESSSRSCQLQLATIVQKRLEASQAASTSGSSQSSYLEAWQVDGNSILRLEELGTGSAAKVYKAKWFGAIDVAEKVFGVSRNASFDQEISLLAKLSHPNIVSILGYWTDEHSCSIVSELMDGDLYHLMERLPRPKVGMGPFSILIACDIMLQVAQGMAYIHDKGVVHRDLKSHNILVRRSKDDDSEYICVKVADFEISKTKERSFLCTHQTSNTGPDRSTAPELIQLPGENKAAQSSFHPYKSDVYAFGMLCFEILTGEKPFSTINSTKEVKRQVLAGIRPVLPRRCPPELKRLIELCWDPDPTHRPYFPEICDKLMGLNFSLLIGDLDLSEEKVQTVFMQTSHVTRSTNPPQWYLNYARQCMESLQLMISSDKVKIHHHQCQYLAHELKVAVEASCQSLGPLDAQTQTHTQTKPLINCPSFEHKLEFVDQLGIMMLLWQCAIDIECFMKDCCSNGWLKIAVTSESVVQSPSTSVSSWGYYLKLCIVLLHNNTLGATPLTMTQLEEVKETQLLVVKQKTLVDDATFFNTLSLLLSRNSSRSDEFHLATILYKRLEVRQTMLATVGQLEACHEHFKIDSRALGQREMLGRGGSATVFKCTLYGAKVAIKTFMFGNGHKSLFMNEVSILGSLCHPNIVHMLGYSKDEKEGIIMMELMDEDLHSLMQKRLQNLPNDSAPFNIHEVVDLMIQVADGMNHLHHCKIVHRDLKSNNVLVQFVKATNLKNNVPELLKVKVIDFGLSARKLRSMTNAHHSLDIGTTRWMAPEVMREKYDLLDQDETVKYPYKSDIYSFGMLCYEILTGLIPFYSLGLKSVRHAVLNGDRPSLPQQCPQALKTLIEACWHPNPTSRPYSTQICQTLRHLQYTLLLPDHEGERQAKLVLETQDISKVFNFSRLSVVKIQNSCLHRGIQLGKGGQETIVYKAILRQSKVAPNCVAQKRFVPTCNEDFKNEITILSYMKHPNIVSLVGYAVDNRSCSIVMELMDDDLHGLMCRKRHRLTHRGPFSIDDAIHVMLQIAQGMDYVHKKNVVHRDLKSYNILVRESIKGKQLDVKVGDFGLSKQMKPGSHLHFNVGTLSWMAPEVMRLKGMSSGTTSKFYYFSNAMGNIPLMSPKRVKKFHDPFKSDIYSFGIVCFEILTRKSPTFHLKNGIGHEVHIDPHKSALFICFLFLEGLIKLQEDPQKIAVVILALLKGFNFKHDPHKAIVMLMILHSKFKKRDQNEVLKGKVLAGHRPIVPDYCPPQLKALIESCWVKDASTRPTFAQIIMGLQGVLSRGH